MMVSRGGHHRARRAGASATLAALPVAAAGALAWAADGLLGAARAPGPVAVDRLVALGAAGACGLMLAAATLGAALTLLVALAGRVGNASQRGRCRRAPHRQALGPADLTAGLAGSFTPALVRRLAGVALGVSLVGAAAGTANATSAAQVPPRSAVAAAFRSGVPDADGHPGPGASLAPGWSLDRPSSPRPASTSRPGGVFVVRRGDTLWDIAAQALGHQATAREVAHAWPRWHHANRRTIGANPDLLMPGQRLREPPARDR
jgi:LysM domain